MPMQILITKEIKNGKNFHEKVFDRVSIIRIVQSLKKMHKIKDMSLIQFNPIEKLNSYKYKPYINSGFNKDYLEVLYKHIPTDYVDAFTTGTAFVV